MEERFVPEGAGSTMGWDKSKDGAPIFTTTPGLLEPSANHCVIIARHGFNPRVPSHTKWQLCGS